MEIGSSRIFLISLFLLMCGSNLAQTSNRKDVGVELPAIVRSKDGALIKNLTADDFEAFEGDNRLKIDLDGKLDAPATIGIVFDLSGSTMVNIGETVDGIQRVVDGAPANSEFFLCIVWRNNVSEIETTTDRKRIRSSLDEVRKYKPVGNTLLFDSIRRAIDRLGAGVFEKRILIVISDGQDNISTTTDIDDLLNLVRVGSLVTYTVNIAERESLLSSFGQRGNLFLVQLTESGGGRPFGNSRGLAFGVKESMDSTWPKEIAEEICNMYYFKAIMQSTPKKPKWRKIDLRLTKVAKERLGSVKLRARRGIYL